MIELVNKKSSIALTNTNNNVEIQTPEQNPVELTDTQGSVAVGGNTGEANLQGPTVVGGYYIPDVDEEGNLTWEGSYEGMKEVPAANIKGKTGDKGDPFKYEDFTEEQLEALKGKAGYTPQKGIDYYTPTEEQEIINKVKNDVTKHNVMVSTDFRFMVFDILWGGSLKIGDIIILSEQSEPDFIVILDSPAYSDNVITIDDTNNIPTPEYGAIYNIGNYCVAAFKCGADAEAVETALKRLDRLESKLAPQYIVEDHEAAYEKTVPYYSCAYADLERIDGVSYTDSEGHLQDAKVTEIVSERVNLWNIDWIEDEYYENTQTGYITNVYNQSLINTNKFVQLTGVKAGDVIRISCKCRAYSGTMTADYGAVRFLSRDTKLQPSIYILDKGFNNGEIKTGTFTVPENFDYDHYWGLYLYGSNTSGSRVEFYDFIISKGEDIPPYQPYRETTIIPIPEEIQNIEGYGRYKSRLNFEDKTLSVSYGIYEFTGKESWNGAKDTGSSNPTSNNFYRYYTGAFKDYMPTASGQKGFCDRYPVDATWAESGHASIRLGQGNSNNMYFYYQSESAEPLTQSQLQELTKGMRVCYPLKDELRSIHTIDIDFDGLLPVGGTAKVRFENEDKQPVPSKITYMLKEDAVFDE